jgi:tetratricopeptide (TPR) repeat protein
MEYRILGPLEVRENGDPVVLGGAKPRALLAILLLHANEVVPVSRLIDELWDDRPPATAENTLQVYVSQLRKVLGSEAVHRQSGGYELRLGVAGLHAMSGDFAASAELIERDQAVMADLGQTQASGSAHLLYADVHALAGDFAEAEKEIAGACEVFERTGDVSSLSTTAALRGQFLYKLGRLEEARRWHALAIETSFVGDLHTQIPATSLGAKLAARGGDKDRARELGEQSVSLAEQTDLSHFRGPVFADLAEVLELTGDPLGARAALERALAICESKGNVVWASATRQSLSGET